MNPFADDPARLDQLAALLASPVPRTPPPDLMRRVQGAAASLWLMAFGAFAAAFSLVFVVLFFPTNLPGELRLRGADTRTLPGRIVQVEPTNLFINETCVYAYGFTFSASATPVEGRCYTTGPRRQPGDTVTVRYLVDSPHTACPEGARLSKTGMAGLFVLFFPLGGLGVVVGTWVVRRRAQRMLIEGTVAEVRVREVTATKMRVNNRTVYRIVTERCDTLGAAPQVQRHSDFALVRLAQERKASGQPMYVLVDPSNPKRALWIERF